ncbi:MAG: aminoglycoside phosphotransferase family protein [Gammaproteobacteria bacterium]
MIPEDIRAITLMDWLEHDLLLKVVRCEPASSDASFRRYFRIVVPDGQFIVMDAPPDKENIVPFIKVARLLKASEVHVPAIYEQNLADGFLLLEDFGNRCFLHQLDDSTADDLYRSALTSLFKLQANTGLEGCDLPRYDRQLLSRELAIFDQWFLQESLDIEMPDSIRAELHEILVSSALEQPHICVHRDFHSRNLMVLDRDSPGVIDFQDAVIGPITYDLVSLLRDCYIDWPEDRVDHWLSHYYHWILNEKLIDSSLDQFRRWFDLMGMQRHLKAIGIFSRLNLRDGKPGYVNDIPRTLNYVVKQARAYPELEGFNQFLQTRILPRESEIV